jgi:hypothetical protein
MIKLSTSINSVKRENGIVVASNMLEQNNVNNNKPLLDDGLPSYLKLHRLMKRITSGGESSIPSSFMVFKIIRKTNLL